MIEVILTAENLKTLFDAGKQVNQPLVQITTSKCAEQFKSGDVDREPNNPRNYRLYCINEKDDLVLSDVTTGLERIHEPPYELLYLIVSYRHFSSELQAILRHDPRKFVVVIR